jgi:hypothetical protein
LHLNPLPKPSCHTRCPEDTPRKVSMNASTYLGGGGGGGVGREGGGGGGEGVGEGRGQGVGRRGSG